MVIFIHTIKIFLKLQKLTLNAQTKKIYTFASFSQSLQYTPKKSPAIFGTFVT